jgi:Transcription factor WhiB
MTTIRILSGEASLRLTRALIDAATVGVRPRCSVDGETSYLFLSEDEHDREQAARMCSGCIVHAECNDVGRFQSFGVFGGRDRTRRQKREDAA